MKTAPHAWPIGTLAVGCVALLATAWASAATALVGERAGLHGGEFWRAWSAHLVHFSWSHLGWSGLVWLAAGAQMERHDRHAWLCLVLLVAPIITVLTLVLEPDLARYGGLSGLATAALVWLGLSYLSQSQGAARAVGAAILLLVTVKWIHGLGSPPGQPMLASFASAAGDVRASPAAHFVGAAAGAVLRLVARLSARKRRIRGYAPKRRCLCASRSD